MMGLDVTHQALLDAPRPRRLPAHGHASGGSPRELVDFALEREGQWYGAPAAAIPDAVAVAHLAIADLVSVADYDVQVDTGNGPARGRTVCEGFARRVARSRHAANAQVGIQIDPKRFEDVLVDAFGRLPYRRRPARRRTWPCRSSRSRAAARR